MNKKMFMLYLMYRKYSVGSSLHKVLVAAMSSKLTIDLKELDFIVWESKDGFARVM